MDLKQLQALGAFVPRTLFKREIEVNRPLLKPESEWANPEVHEFSGEHVRETMTTFIRKRASADFMELLATEDRAKASVAILRCVCNEDGKEVFESVDQVNQLEDWLFMPLMLAVGEVNKFGPKRLPPKTSSGAKSRSASAVAASRNGKRRSAKKNASHGSNTAVSAAP